MRTKSELENLFHWESLVVLQKQEHSNQWFGFTMNAEKRSGGSTWTGGQTEGTEQEDQLVGTADCMAKIQIHNAWGSHDDTGRSE